MGIECFAGVAQLTAVEISPNWARHAELRDGARSGAADFVAFNPIARVYTQSRNSILESVGLIHIQAIVLFREVGAGIMSLVVSPLALRDIK